MTIRCWPPAGGVMLVFALPFFSPAARAQEPLFEYQFDAPTRVGGPSAATVELHATVEIVTNGLAAGEQGARAWQIAAAVDSDWRIVAASTKGTLGESVDGGGLRDGGFEHTELTIGPGNEGVVSVVVLSNTQPISLPPETSPSPVLAITVEGRAPDEGCVPCRLFFPQGLTGSGEEVRNVTTFVIDSFTPVLHDRTVFVCGACFESGDTAPWRLLRIGDAAAGAARRVGARAFELCGIASGHGPNVDSMNSLVDKGHADMQLITRLDDLSAAGVAGVCMRQSARIEDSAYAGIAVERTANGGRIVSTVRRARGGRAEMMGKPVDFSLPVYIGVRRVDTRVITSYGSSRDKMIQQMVHDVGDTALAEEYQDLLMFAASTAARPDDQAEAASATFSDPEIQITEHADPPVLLGVHPSVVPPAGAQRLAIGGTGVGEALAVTVGGVEAAIVQRNEDEIIVEIPSSPGEVLADVVVETPEGSQILDNAVRFAGVAVARGDCNCDEKYDISDALAKLGFLFLGGPPCCCFHALDANGDDKGDVSDPLTDLTYLFLGGRQPPPPFPDPGVVLEPSIPCGLPPAPEITDVSTDLIREGDLITIKGRNFSLDAEEGMIRFGDGTRGRIIEASETSLVVEIGRVLTVDPGRVAVLRRVPDYLIAPFTCGMKPCRRFDVIGGFKSLFEVRGVPSPEETIIGRSTADRERGTISLQFDPPALVPFMETLVDVRGTLYLPTVQGASLGSVDFQFSYINWDHPLAPNWVKGLTENLGATLGVPFTLGDGAGAASHTDAPLLDLHIAAFPDQGLIELRAGDKLKPFLDEHVFDGDITIVPSLGCNCGGYHPELHERAYGWCRFTELIEPCGGAPKFMYFVPKNLVNQQSGNIFPLPHPLTTGTGPKGTMYNRAAYCHVRKHNLWNPCKAQKLAGLGVTDVPQFPCEALVVKTFWRTTTDAGTAAKWDALYYHYDHGDQRHYLTGLHFTDKSRPEWFWADLYVPTSLGGGGGCGGSANGRPVGAPWVGPWTNYHMCTNIVDELSADCGNLEISVECEQTCQFCHKSGSVSGVKTDFLHSLFEGPNVEGSPHCD